MKKRVLSILLALMMVVSMMSAMTVTSFATDLEPVVVSEEQTVAASLPDLGTLIKDYINKKGVSLKNTKPLIGIKNVKLSPNLSRDVRALLAAVKAGKSSAELENLYDAVKRDIQIKAKDVVVFSKYSNKEFSPILFAEADSTVYVKALDQSNKKDEVLPEDLLSLSTLLPSGIKLTPVTTRQSGKVTVYKFTMPNRLVTGYDFIGYTSKLKNYFNFL